jgi:hypothetical protein
VASPPSLALAAGPPPRPPSGDPTLIPISPTFSHLYPAPTALSRYRALDRFFTWLVTWGRPVPGAARPPFLAPYHARPLAGGVHSRRRGVGDGLGPPVVTG